MSVIKKCENCKFLKWKANEEPCKSCDEIFREGWQPEEVEGGLESI